VFNASCVGRAKTNRRCGGHVIVYELQLLQKSHRFAFKNTFADNITRPCTRV